MSYPQCNHIMSDGMKCKSPALKRQSYCYFHHRYNQRQRRRVQLGGPVGTNQNTGIEMPIIESWETIQIAVQEILEAIIDSRLEPKRAGLMLYALQLASSNLKMMQAPGISQPKGVTELPEDADLTGAPGAVLEVQTADPSSDTCPTRDDKGFTGDSYRPHSAGDTSATTSNESSSQAQSSSDCSEGAAVSAITTTPNDLSSRGGRESDEGSAVSPTTTTPNDLSSRGGRESDEGSAVSTTITDLGLSKTPPKGNGFSRAVEDANNGVSAPEAPARRHIPDPLADLRKQYPAHDDEALVRFLPHPDDDHTRLYFKETDGPYAIREIKLRRAWLGIYT